MLKENTVYVIGAGASKEAGLVTGDELTTKIASVVSDNFDFGRFEEGDSRFGDALLATIQTRKETDASPYLVACRLIKGAMPQALSIDNFIHIHRGNVAVEVCGKLAIARAILREEQGSLLFVNPKSSSLTNTIHFSALGKTWLNAFIKLLTEYCTVEDLAARLPMLSLVIFNYDRCLEHFLFHSFMNVYGVGSEQAAALVAKINIYHPYGALGPLPWQRLPDAIDFGLDPHAMQLRKIAERLKTFTEGADPKLTDIDRMRDALLRARTVVFLGFAFHPLNLDLIFPKPKAHSQPVNILGTALGLSSQDAGLVSAEMVRLFNVAAVNQVCIDNDATCATLLSRYWRSLSQG